jgi:hypothetical protein
VKTVKFKTVLDFFHIANLRNASSDEAMFSRILYSYSADYSPLELEKQTLEVKLILRRASRVGHSIELKGNDKRAPKSVPFV